MNDLERTLREHAAGLPAAPPAELEDRLSRRGHEEGTRDVAYGRIDSPLGRLTVAATPRGLVRVAYPFKEPDTVLEELARKVSPRMLEAPERLDDVRRELDEYFEGRRKEFDLPIDWSLTRGFVRHVLRETAKSGYGDLRTYSDVARAAGSPRAVRAAGNALGA